MPSLLRQNVEKMEDEVYEDFYTADSYIGVDKDGDYQFKLKHWFWKQEEYGGKIYWIEEVKMPNKIFNPNELANERYLNLQGIPYTRLYTKKGVPSKTYRRIIPSMNFFKDTFSNVDLKVITRFFNNYGEEVKIFNEEALGNFNYYE